MADVVLILGAGCSQGCGAPLMKDFLRKAKNLYRTSQVGDRAQEFERVFDVISQLQSIHSKSRLDTENIEALFSAIDMAKTIGRLPGYDAAQIDTVLTSLRWLIVRTLEESMLYFGLDYSAVRGAGEYEALAQTIQYLMHLHKPGLSVAIITLNYDVALELALMNAFIPFTYGFDSAPARDRYVVPVLKLHGSLNWATAGQAIHVWQPSEFASHFGVWESRKQGRPRLLVGSKLQAWFSTKGVSVDETPALVPPTWNKGATGNDLAQVWRSAATELLNAEYLYVMGYSMPITDQFFPYLYALGTLGGKPFREIAVLDPDKDVAGRFRQLLGPGADWRFRQEPPMTFDNAAGTLKQLFEAG